MAKMIKEGEEKERGDGVLNSQVSQCTMKKATMGIPSIESIGDVRTLTLGMQVSE